MSSKRTNLRIKAKDYIVCNHQWLITTIISVIVLIISWIGLNQLTLINKQLELDREVAKIDSRNSMLELMRSVSLEFSSDQNIQLALEEMENRSFHPQAFKNLSFPMKRLIDFFEYLAWIRGKEFEKDQHGYYIAPLSNSEALRADYSEQAENAIEILFKRDVLPACELFEVRSDLEQQDQKSGYRTFCNEWLPILK